MNFQKEQANVYASYYNPIVKVVLNKDGELLRSGDRGICLYYFLEDDDLCCEKTKQVKFSEFVDELIKKGISHFGYAYSELPDWSWHTDAVYSFNKKQLDAFLKTANEEEKRKYAFLFE